MSDINQLTPDDLRRDIAKALGYSYAFIRRSTGKGIDNFSEYEFLAHGHGAGIFRIYGTTEPTEADIWKTIGPRASFPDWPNDASAALELCVTLARPKEYEVVVYASSLDDPLVYHACIQDYFPDLGRDESLVAADGVTLALALSRLALKALQEDV